ncbi:MAG: hypothetical protein P4L88_05700 [Rhodoferax sp.]|nr:hypothetical protein [Rhodoferax sp.]
MAGLILLFAVSGAHADPSARVARLGYIDGSVSFSPAGDVDWVQAALNRPLTTGDRLWTDTDSRAELQVGGAAIRLGASTDIMIINLDDTITQIQLSQGALKIRVRQMGPHQSFEVDTPNLSFSLSQAGDYRIDVDPSGDATLVAVQLGQAQVYGDGASYLVQAGQGYRFYGTNLSDYEAVSAQFDDDLDRWSHDRDRSFANSDAARYVSYDVVGYEDLDAYGSWRSDPSYGNVWRPHRVPSGWTPYRDGHWAWIDPWGWSWVADEPWGYAVSHYGRWAHVGGSWCWIPGPRREQAVYAPALVVFLGGKNFQGAVSVGDGGGAVGWFPLAPREVYQPAYPVSRGYFDRVNRSNTVIPSTTITNVYNTRVTQTNSTVVNVTKVVYVNQRIPGAVVAVPTRAFTESQPVSKHAVAVSKDEANRATATHVAAFAPTLQSVHGGAPDARSKPPSHERHIVARTAPPAPALGFVAQQSQLAEKPGTPIDDQQRKQLKFRTQSDSVRNVTVVPIAKVNTPTAAPPPVAPKGRSPSDRKADKANAPPVQSETPKTDAVKALPATKDRARTPAPQIPDGKIGADKANEAKASAARADAQKAEQSRAAAAKAERDKADAAKANWAREDAAKADVIRAAAEKANADKVNEAKASAARADAQKAEQSRAAAAKAERDKADAAKANRARDEAAKAQSNDAAGAKAAAERAKEAKASAARADALKAEADKAKGPRRILPESAP